MPEEVLFETERSQSREDIAAYLRTVAEKLESGEEFSLSAGDQSVTLAPPAQPTFEVKAERETPASGGQGELSVEFEIEWDEGGDGDGGGTDSSLSIE
ncbi:amphi-Trp domain-containing protein [Halorussus salilacus]|uniref:amphi-Trp domain-containing protein n=1 Tax=Halorussus salilacus TaxID=2953750 RepID=UPI0020A0D338|nr:amphi-Trp domain-containing protein [Halorussus salilacus]USZ67737.1 amphi-Trp domain-containing protein [Halorussus salilacus]